jgi:hypothetical protein
MMRAHPIAGSVMFLFPLVSAKVLHMKELRVAREILQSRTLI